MHNTQGDNLVSKQATESVRLMHYHTTGDTMQPCSHIRIYENRIKRMTQTVERATRGLFAPHR